ncbi:PrpF protein-domain-containing protein [Aspergillus sergii]|uniref:PrpF protein-domain-containing protein n=1 Tax=Aspergillus sergii TaxID=1034303 RepID=A0A5N6X009_9EURO|nr:PrpF protein-domain-containing protein [Aspergillus sergii]
MPGISKHAISHASNPVRTGLFIHEHYLPSSKDLWAPILLSALGSAEADKRQLNGVGGATSTTSKVAVIRKSKIPGVDVDYTFVQVAPDQAQVDMTGNCENMASGVGPFALDEELQMDITVFNTNTQQILVEAVHVTPDGKFSEDGDYSITGVRGTASPVRMNSIKPAGSMTGGLFPSGAKRETLTFESSLVDAANPYVLVDANTMPAAYHDSEPTSPLSPGIIEEIRVAGAVRFGLAQDTTTAGRAIGTPKIALLYPYRHEIDVGRRIDEADIEVLPFSLGQPHPSLQLTGPLCVGTALSIPGTVAWDVQPQAPSVHHGASQERQAMMINPTMSTKCTKTGRHPRRVSLAASGQECSPLTIDNNDQPNLIADHHVRIPHRFPSSPH